MRRTGKPQLALTRLFALACAVCLLAQAAPAQTSTITVQVDRPGAAVSPTLFGLFFEDINFGADGGLYPERVKNRSFEFPEPLMGWKKIESDGAGGSVSVLEENPINANNSHYLRLVAEGPGKSAGLSNEGFRGMGLEKGAAYTFSVYARLREEAHREGDARRVERGAVRLLVRLKDAAGRELGRATLGGFTSEWKKHTLVIRPTATSLKAHLDVLAEGRGTLDVDMVSLFPKGTYRNRENGLRADLVQLLKEMKPGFLRFPGGCIVEGRDLDNRYQWETTIGDITDRRLIMNRWNVEFKHKPAPDYYQSFGLGFYEYFQLAEDLGAEPLPILNCGMACQFNSKELAPLDQLDSYIQDALDLIAFANDPVTTTWGRRRAELGHPRPFNLKMIGVGNEQWGQQYIDRYKIFARALKEKHPEIALVSTAGPDPDGQRFDFAWANLRQLNADIIDEHYYRPPGWFLSNVNRYDSYSRTGPKVFAGEYAAQSAGIAKPTNRNNWECALAEAAFMTGLERNSDVVVMASYAPLLAHVDAWQWTPDLIWFDNLRSYGTPNYYVQKMFSSNLGTTILPVLLNGQAKNGQDNLFASATLDKPTGEVVLKVVNATPSPKETRINLAGAVGVKRSGRAFVLSSSDLKAENSFEQPFRVAPVERRLAIAAGEFSYTFAPNSLTVLRTGGRGKAR
ncbi:MAG TPA: alpha-L-arabinofuranosidase C-terminal domain-containing protein [Pyrinomonadaceae bacterium]|jgi:alpha-N-arabinofuranosidase